MEIVPEPVCGVCLETSFDCIDLESLYDMEDEVTENSNILESQNCNKLTFMDCFRECTRLGEDVSDYVPQSLCIRCSLDLKIAYKFLKKAKSAAQFFQKLIEKTELKEIQMNVELVKFEPEEDCSISDGLSEIEEIPFPSTESEATAIDVFDHKELTVYEDDNAEAFKLEELKESIETSVLKEASDINAKVINKNYKTKQLKGTLSRKNVKTSESADSYVCHQNLNLAEHIQESHKHDVKCQHCEFKDKEFKVREHEKLNHSNNYLCDICSKTFVSAGKLNAHIKYHEQLKSNFKSDACEICGKRFSTQSYLRRHLEVHKNERKLYKCGQCDKIYFSKYSLELHKKIHNGETISCLECGRQCTRQKDLKVHMRFHTREYPFNCEICDKVFILKSHLQTHMWRHQGIKLKCDDCGKLFISRHALREHSYLHTEMPFPCCYCKKAYPSKYKFTVHLKSAHSICLSEEEIQKIKRPIKKKAPRKLTLVRDENPIKGKRKSNIAENTMGI